MALIDAETITPTMRATRKRPILQSRCQIAHVLIKRIAVNGIKIQSIYAKYRVHSPSAKIIPAINSPDMRCHF
jgi:hypothetical protein